ncbi:hypothetical protein [Paraglaciecola polaris]|uniref:Uncharacterized protein n=1 Tax=Paraglaciecola polaris LMG 21857 TaxID=1129793 RepID=K7A8G6_9ALTE|nr:hypothetical protein [Paraglaciecola polaris]GAC31725.1 hypothetical protein GPLA_0809 [Paraglaciecola polaris LMG 21857]
MIDDIDILTLSEEIERDSQSGALRKKLLKKGETLYGVAPDFPDYIERETLDGVSLGHWENGAFVAEICLIE